MNQIKGIEEHTSPGVAAVIARTHLAVIPFGSVEQHGPHLPCGTDTFAAEQVARVVSDQMDGLYVPFGPYGVTPIHAGHPGTIDLRRSTFESLLSDICEHLVSMDVTRFVFVNWHEGNIASMDGVASEIQSRHPGVYIVTAHACYTAQRVYADQGGELTHGGGIETLAILAHDPSLVELERAGDATRPPEAVELDAMRRSREVYGYITDVAEIDEDGWYGDPSWASQDLARGFAETVGSDIAKRATVIFDLREGP